MGHGDGVCESVGERGKGGERERGKEKEKEGKVLGGRGEREV